MDILLGMYHWWHGMSFGLFFNPFMPKTTGKIKKFRNLFLGSWIYNCVPNTMIIGYLAARVKFGVQTLFPFLVILGSFFYLFTPTTGYKIHFFRNKKKQTLQYVKFKLMYHSLWLLDVMLDIYHRWCVICHFGPCILPFHTC